jgi:hypothetical protein
MGDLIERKDFPSLRLPNQGMVYFQRCFKQRYTRYYSFEL